MDYISGTCKAVLDAQYIETDYSQVPISKLPEAIQFDLRELIKRKPEIELKALLYFKEVLKDFKGIIFPSRIASRMADIAKFIEIRYMKYRTYT